MKKIKLLSLAFVCVSIPSVFAANSFDSVKAEGTNYTLTFNGMRGSGDNMNSKGIWAGNGNGTCTHQFVDSTASGGYCSQMIQTGTDTFKVFAWANSATTAFSTPGTYGVYFRYKTSSEDPVSSLKIEWPGDWQIKKTISDFTTEWKECYFTMNLTTSIFGDGTCLFDLGSKGTAYIDDFTCVLVDRSVTSGTAIGELPAIPSKPGYSGSWQIDGNDITGSTIYNYGQNKVAEINYSPVTSTYTLTFNGMRGNTDNIHSLGVWNGNNKGSCTNQHTDATASGGYCGEFIQTGTDTFKGFAWANSTAAAFTAEGTYGVYFRYKTSLENPVSSLSFEWCGDWQIKKTVSDFTTDWKECYFTMKLTSSILGNGTCLFDLGSKGTAYIDDFNCVLIDKSVTGGEAIGELPAIPNKTGYICSWQIDGADITASTVYNYGTNKTAEICYEKITSLVLEGFSSTVKYKETFVTDNIVLKANNKVVTPDSHNYNVDSSILGIHSISASYNGVSTNENVKVTNNGAEPGTTPAWTGEDQATSWSNFFINETRKDGGACRLEDRTERVNALKAIWPTFKEEYNWMIGDSKDAFFDSTSSKIVEARNHYLYIISQYEDDGLEDFVRNTSDNALQRLDTTNSVAWSKTQSDNFILVVISVATISLFLVFVVSFKKKKYRKN